MAVPVDPTDSANKNLEMIQAQIREWNEIITKNESLTDEEFNAKVKGERKTLKAFEHLYETLDSPEMLSLENIQEEWTAGGRLFRLGEVPEDVQDAVSGIEKMLELSEMVNIPNEDDLRELVAGFHVALRDAEAMLEKAGSTARSGTKGIRGIGVELGVSCDCGQFARNSTNGDWTSIRYQAKVHAEECSTANPADDDYINNLDLVREAIVADGLAEWKSGGLTFTREGGRPSVQRDPEVGFAPHKTPDVVNANLASLGS